MVNDKTINMAIIGQGVQAGLGRVDYTPYLQGAMAGAQGIAQGIAGAGAAASKAIDLFKKNQEDEKAANAAIKVSEPLIKGLRALADQKDQSGNPILSPEIKSAIDQFAISVSDPSIPNRDRARIAQQGMQQFSGLINAGISGAQTASALAQSAAQTDVYKSNAAKIAFDLASEKADNKAIGNALKAIMEQGDSVSPTSIISGYIKEGGSLKGLESLRNVLPQPKGGSKIEKYNTTEDGIPYEVTIETYPDGSRKELGRIRTDVPSGFKTTSTGGIAPIEGSKEDVARKASEAATQQRYEKGLAEATVMLNSIAGAKGIVKNPYLSVQGMFSTALGWTPMAASLDGYYKTIGTNTALQTIRQAREESPTGGSPFGQLNQKEFEGAAAIQGTLNRSLQDDVALENMDNIANVLFDAYPQLKSQYSFILEKEQEKLKKEQDQQKAKSYPTKLSTGAEFDVMAPR